MAGFEEIGISSPIVPYVAEELKEDPPVLDLNDVMDEREDPRTHEVLQQAEREGEKVDSEGRAPR